MITDELDKLIGSHYAPSLSLFPMSMPGDFNRGITMMFKKPDHIDEMQLCLDRDRIFVILEIDR